MPHPQKPDHHIITGNPECAIPQPDPVPGCRLSCDGHLCSSQPQIAPGHRNIPTYCEDNRPLRCRHCRQPIGQRPRVRTIQICYCIKIPPCPLPRRLYNWKLREKTTIGPTLAQLPVPLQGSSEQAAFATIPKMKCFQQAHFPAESPPIRVTREANIRKPLPLHRSVNLHLPFMHFSQ